MSISMDNVDINMDFNMELIIINMDIKIYITFSAEMNRGPNKFGRTELL